MGDSTVGSSFLEEGDVLEQALHWYQQGHKVALATVISTWGSAPRGVGSQMAITDSGDIVGSVSGGCIEGSVVYAARGVIAEQKTRLLSFSVSNETAWGVGLTCGGEITIYVESLV